jgi:bifunctional DNA-binding transcriptional regulator/antitoxin component of YhaV-PrlF toxin-antitoxin module
MRITSKGQVTIPLAIRKQAGFLPNTEVAFEMSRGVVVLRKVASHGTRGRKLVERIRGKATTSLSTDEILALTRRG